VRARLEQLGVGDFDLQPGKSGQFDVSVNGELAFSRHKVGRFPTDDEIDDLIKA
jgi:selT/selW/selH-like putative selenoprotein